MKTVSVRRIIRAGILAVLLCLPMATFAQQRAIPLWPGVAPGSENWTQKEVEHLNPQKQEMVRNVVQPTLTVFLPERAKANGTAVIVCPGGGNMFLSWQSEGTEVAQWLAAHGIAAFVLKYRLRETAASEEEFQKQIAPRTARVRGKAAPGSANRSASPSDTTPASATPVTTAAPRPAGPSYAADDGRQAVKVIRQRASDAIVPFSPSPAAPPRRVGTSRSVSANRVPLLCSAAARPSPTES